MTGNNHYAGCVCGWCVGGWRNHGATRHSGNAYATADTLRARIYADASDIRSFTIPNATCLVCGASVFFYQSPYGGRVFFDELGPPWPKHPCTDNGTIRLSTLPIALDKIQKLKARWQTYQWSICKVVSLSFSNFGLNKLFMSTLDGSILFMLKTAERPKIEEGQIVYLSLSSSEVEVRYMVINKNGDVERLWFSATY